MDQVAQILTNLCQEYQGALYLATVVIAILINGILLMMGGDHVEKVKKNFPFTVLGMIIAAGAITLGSQYADKFRF